MSQVKASARTRFWAATLGVRSRWAEDGSDPGVRDARAALAYSQMLDILAHARESTDSATSAKLADELLTALRELGG